MSVNINCIGTALRSLFSGANQKPAHIELSERFYAQTSQEFSERMEKLGAEGLIDFKFHTKMNPDPSRIGIVATLNNALRLREEGKAIPYHLAFQKD